MRKISLAILVALLQFAGALFAQSAVAERIIGVRLSDIQKYIGKSSAIVGIDEIQKNVDQLGSSRGQVVLKHGAFVQSQPRKSGDTVEFELLVLSRLDAGNGKLWQKDSEEDENDEVYASASLVKVSYYLSARASYLTVIKEFYPGELNFTAAVSLLDRKVVLTDSQNGLKLVFPIGVGSLDEAVMNAGATTLLTPRFKTAYLTKEATISKRHKPRYFSGKPFIRIVEGKSNEFTAIGFHTEINDSFVRGFDSHGCMRLRDEDLFLLHDLIKELQNRIHLTVAFKIDDPSDHPAPKRNKGYKRVKNAGTADAPKIILDRDNLMQTEYVDLDVPLSKIIDDAADHYAEKYQYESLATYNRQREEEIRQCKEEVAPMPELTSRDKKEKEDALEKCIKEGKRRLSLKDKLYRWWVH